VKMTVRGLFGEKYFERTCEINLVQALEEEGTDPEVGVAWDHSREHNVKGLRMARGMRRRERWQSTFPFQFDEPRGCSLCP
jgi:hypothetical protein